VPAVRAFHPFLKSTTQGDPVPELNWSSQIDSPSGDRNQRHRVLLAGRPAAYGEIVTAWQHDEAFRDFLLDLLAGSPWPACYFETPAVSQATLDQPFEFVLIDSRLLAGVAPEPEVFREHFERVDSSEGVATFANLGGDAVLVAPCPVGPPDAYPHLAAFARKAPRSQQHALWRHVGRAAESWIRDRPEPVWISTAGQGVFWLHVRLDRRPKYYNYSPYRQS
jgi:hypothetical protein